MSEHNYAKINSTTEGKITTESKINDDDDTFILNTNACDPDVDKTEVVNLLPQCKTYILEAKMIDKEDFPKLNLKFLLNAHNEEEIKKWLAELQESNKMTYSTYSTANSKGKYVTFKQRLVCQHKTRSKNVYEPSIKSRTNTKNTNCPSRMTVVLHAVKERYRGKDKEKYALMREMPCEVTFIATHNHSTSDSLRFRKMSDEVKEKLLNLFHNGHSAGTALEALKAEIQLNNDNYEEILADRKHCPTYYDCYYLYKQEFVSKYGPWRLKSESRKFSKKNSDKCNEEKTKKRKDCVKIIYQEPEYVICVPPPTSEVIIETEKIDEDEIININDNSYLVETSKSSAMVVLDNINTIFTQFIEKSPVEVATALNTMYETLQNIKSPSTFASHCINFGSSNRQQNLGNYMGVQFTSMNRRKTNLTGKNHVGGRPRKSAICKRSPTRHTLSKKVISHLKNQLQYEFIE